MSQCGFNFDEKNMHVSITQGTMSPIPQVLEINLDAQEDLFVRSPTFFDLHGSALLVPAEIVALGSPEIDTERVKVSQLTPAVSPKDLLSLESSPRDRSSSTSLATTIRLKSELRLIQKQLQDMKETGVRKSEAAELLQRVQELTTDNRMLKRKIENSSITTLRLKKELSDAQNATAGLSSKLREQERYLESLRRNLEGCSLDQVVSEVEYLREENSSLRSKERKLEEEVIYAKEHIKLLELELLQSEGTRIGEVRMKDLQLEQSRKLLEQLQQGKESREAAGEVEHTEFSSIFNSSRTEDELEKLQAKQTEYLQALEKSSKWQSKAPLELELRLIRGSIATVQEKLKRQKMRSCVCA